MTVRLNGRERDLPEGATVADAVRLLGVEREQAGVAAAVDGDVVPRDAWGLTPLREGAAVEVVRAAAGG
jgi:sulfur carrier protein